MTPLTFFSCSTKLLVLYIKLKLCQEQVHNLFSIHSLHLKLGSRRLYSMLQRKGPFFQPNGGTYSNNYASCFPCAALKGTPTPTPSKYKVNILLLHKYQLKLPHFCYFLNFSQITEVLSFCQLTPQMSK